MKKYLYHFETIDDFYTVFDQVELSDPFVSYTDINNGYVTYKPAVNIFSNYSYTDLGLPSGTVWATMNLGASKPEDFGDYYAWGEVETKSDFTWSNYKYGYDEDHQTKYNRTDGKTILDDEDDAAIVIWGSGWHIPDEEQFQELLSNTTVEKVYSGIKGIRFTGSNGNSIFLPASYVYNGYYSCCYWSKNLNVGDYYDGAMIFNSESINASSSNINCNITSRSRYAGLSIRPVLNINKLVYNRPLYMR